MEQLPAEYTLCAVAHFDDATSRDVSPQAVLDQQRTGLETQAGATDIEVTWGAGGSFIFKPSTTRP